MSLFFSLMICSIIYTVLGKEENDEEENKQTNQTLETDLIS
jgi:hypothetical protein